MMLSASKAKEIMNKAVEEHNAEVRRAIEIEAERVCSVIEDAAGKRLSSYKIAPGTLHNPEGVAKYLSQELGYTCNHYNNGTIVVHWDAA